jgi:hypothetical protein
LHGDAATVRHYQLADQPQPEAHAAALRGRGMLVALEDAKPIGGADPCALIADGDGDASGRFAHDEADRAALAELQRVREKVRDDLLDGDRIPPALNGLRGPDDRDALGAGERREHALHGRADRCADIYEFGSNEGTARALELGHVLEQRLEPLNLGANDAQRRRDHVAGKLGCVGFRDPDVEQRRRNGRAQLVAEQINRI